MKYISILITGLLIASCQNTTQTNNPSPSPTASVIASASPVSVQKYTREDYLRIFDCTLAIKDRTLDPGDRGKIAAHRSLIANDMIWERSGKNNTAEYDNDVVTISNPLGCK